MVHFNEEGVNVFVEDLLTPDYWISEDTGPKKGEPSRSNKFRSRV